MFFTAKYRKMQRNKEVKIQINSIPILDCNVFSVYFENMNDMVQKPVLGIVSSDYN
jgi:hypothetical protein